MLFDFGGTLDADGVRWSVRFHEAYRAEGGALPFEQFEPLFQESDRALAALGATPRMGFQVMVDAQCELLCTLLPDPRLDAGALAERFLAPAVAIARRNRGVLAKLRERYRLGVVSNFTPNLAACLEELDLLAQCDVVVNSALVGFTKPDSRQFEMALRALHVIPDSAWMVGDNPDTDLVPAAKLGLRTCWIAPSRARRRMSPGIPTARIFSLIQLPWVLDADARTDPRGR